MGPYPYLMAAPLARALVRHAPERLIWGSDWPHTSLTQVYKQPAADAAELFGLLFDWVECEKLKDAILVDNPERLLGAGSAHLFS